MRCEMTHREESCRCRGGPKTGSLLKFCALSASPASPSGDSGQRERAYCWPATRRAQWKLEALVSERPNPQGCGVLERPSAAWVESSPNRIRRPRQLRPPLPMLHDCPRLPESAPGEPSEPSPCTPDSSLFVTHRVSYTTRGFLLCPGTHSCVLGATQVKPSHDSPVKWF